MATMLLEWRLEAGAAKRPKESLQFRNTTIAGARPSGYEEPGDEEEGLDVESIAQRIEDAGKEASYSIGEEHDAPDWLKLVREAAKTDPGWSEILTGDEESADEVVSKVRERAAWKTTQESMSEVAEGTIPDVRFRSVDPFSLWLWVEFASEPDEEAQSLLRETLDSWYILGRLGAFNEANFQCRRVGDVSNMPYDEPRNAKGTRKAGAQALMHEKAEAEFKGRWARCWVNIGTADEVALDCLVNSLLTLSEEWSQLRTIIVGGINSDWTEGTENPPTGEYNQPVTIPNES